MTWESNAHFHKFYSWTVPEGNIVSNIAGVYFPRPFYCSTHFSRLAPVALATVENFRWGSSVKPRSFPLIKVGILFLDSFHARWTTDNLNRCNHSHTQTPCYTSKFVLLFNNAPENWRNIGKANDWLICTEPNHRVHCVFIAQQDINLDGQFNYYNKQNVSELGQNNTWKKNVL